MDERLCWLFFSLCNGIGPKKFQMLLESFGSAENAWNAKETELVACGIGKVSASQILAFKNAFSPERYRERMQKHNVDFFILTDQVYPALLKQIERPPFVLYVKGNKELVMAAHDDKRLAVVGTRKVTDYGRQVTESLTTDLAERGYIIVSGLALGVDAIAHATTLDAKGQTIAVLGSGVDYCTPRENQALYEKILAQGGAIVSEVPLGYMPNKGSFPMRNRIIAGLSVGVLVTEGAEDSGSLITASNAASQQRKVFAVPGPITSSVSRGPISLINKGAKIVTSVNDILDALNVKGLKSIKSKNNIKGDNKDEQQIIDLLITQDLHFDEIVKLTGFESSHVGTMLSVMEMKGVLLQHSSGMFTLVDGT